MPCLILREQVNSLKTGRTAPCFLNWKCWDSSGLSFVLLNCILQGMWFGKELDKVSSEACKRPQSRIWSTRHAGDARASSFVSVLDHFYLEACALCVQEECCIPGEMFSSAVCPPLCPYLCCMGCLTNLWRSQAHVCTNTSTSGPLLTRSLPIPPFRLCGGNLEMLQGRALELDNICQETSTKDPCKGPERFLSLQRQAWNCR